MKNEDEFREFAAARTPSLVRAAHLLCGNHHEAEDLVQETLAKVYLAWRRTRIDNPAAYARTTLTRTFISRRRKRSASDIPVTLDAGRTDGPSAVELGRGEDHVAGEALAEHRAARRDRHLAALAGLSVVHVTS